MGDAERRKGDLEWYAERKKEREEGREIEEKKIKKAKSK